MQGALEEENTSISEVVEEVHGEKEYSYFDENRKLYQEFQTLYTTFMASLE